VCYRNYFDAPFCTIGVLLLNHVMNELILDRIIRACISLKPVKQDSSLSSADPPPHAWPIKGNKGWSARALAPVDCICLIGLGSQVGSSLFFYIIFYFTARYFPRKRSWYCAIFGAKRVWHNFLSISLNLCAVLNKKLVTTSELLGILTGSLTLRSKNAATFFHPNKFDENSCFPTGLWCLTQRAANFVLTGLRLDP
jgi:hypothetical protein